MNNGNYGNNNKYKKHGDKNGATYCDSNGVFKRRIAVTLTTGLAYTPKNVKDSWRELIKIIGKYSRNFLYSFHMEVYNEDMELTCIHFHGTVSYPVTAQKTVMAFLRHWGRRMGFPYWDYLKATPKDLFTWHYCYCRKQVPDLKDLKKPTNLTRLTTGSINTFINKSKTKGKSILTFLGCSTKGQGAEE